MADKIFHKRSLTTGSIPTTSSLSAGELAINVPDGKIFLLKSGSDGQSVESAITSNSTSSIGTLTLSGSLILSGSTDVNSGSVLDVATDNISFDFDFLSFSGSAEITGSLIVTSGITGSLFGTSSWAENVVTASYALVALSSSIATSASYATTSSLPLLGITTASFSDPNLTFTKGDGTTFDVDISGLNMMSASYSATASYVNPLTQDVTITGSLLLTGSHISVVDYIDFNNTGIPTPADQEGRIYWDEDNGTLSLGMHGGQVVQQIGLEEYFYVKNQTGTTILNGTVTYASGTLGASGRLLADLMIADGTIPYYFALGITTEDIVDGDDGYVTQFGLVRGINTTGSNGETWNDGDVLYVSPTVAGTLTKFEPEAPNLRLQMAIVVSAATNGSIFVRPDLGSDVGSLHNVLDTSTTASYGDLFVKSGSVWTSTNQLTGSYGLTGSLTATSFTGSLFGTASQALTASYVNPLTQNVIVTGSVDVLNGNINLDANAFFLQGTSVGGGTVSLIGVDSSDQVYIGDQGLTNILADDVIISGSLIVSGSNTNLISSLTTKTTRITTSTYSVLDTDYRLGIRYTLTGSCTLQLPDIFTYGERELRIKDEEGNADTNNIIVSASAGDLIDGSTALTLDRNYIAISLYNDGISNWYIE